MTSDGSAITRLHRAIANPRASAMQIRAIVAELPGPVALEYALAIPLAPDRPRARDVPPGPPRAGAPGSCSRGGYRSSTLSSRWRRSRPSPGPAPAGAEALIELSQRYGLRRVDELVGDWLRTR